MLQERFVSLSTFMVSLLMVFLVWEERGVRACACACVCRAEGGGGGGPKCIDLVRTQLASELH